MSKYFLTYWAHFTQNCPFCNGHFDIPYTEHQQKVHNPNYDEPSRNSITSVTCCTSTYPCGDNAKYPIEFSFSYHFFLFLF